MQQYTEEAFETAIENHLLTTGGYIKRKPDGFNRARCLDIDIFQAFIQ